MLFTSYSFIAFLALLFLSYYLVPRSWQWALLLAASYIFYAFAGLWCLAFILFTTVSAYAVSRLLGRAIVKENDYVSANRDTLSKEERKAYRARAKKKRLYVLTVGLLLNFGILAVIKYTAFALNNVNSVIGLFGGEALTVPDLLLPMGISFYIFQTCGYLIDVYRGRVEPQRNIAKLALFVSFFPQLVQGPISRYGELGEQLTAPHRFCGKTFTFGIQRILWGYFKKLVIADRVLVAMNTMLDAPEEYKGAYVLLLIIVYSIQIYADFTGGIDITIGVAQCLGIKLTENFDRPFASRSTKEYWRRWHISMGAWFREYIFLPVSVTRPMMKLNRRLTPRLGRVAASKIIAYSASLLTWFLTGLWHGAGWNFIVWGLLNCIIIIISETLEPLYAKFHARLPRLTGSAVWGGFCAVRTFLLMGIVRSLDCYRNVGVTFSMWGSMLTMRGFSSMLGGGILDLGLSVTDIVIVAAAVTVVFAVSKIPDIREKLYRRPVLCACLSTALFLSIILFGAYGVGYDASQFIYNQF